jgi:hypothetical protein
MPRLRTIGVHFSHWGGDSRASQKVYVLSFRVPDFFLMPCIGQHWPRAPKGPASLGGNVPAGRVLTFKLSRLPQKYRLNAFLGVSCHSSLVS